MKNIVVCLFLILFSGILYCQTPVVINNLKPRIDTDGKIIDAHDGRILKAGDKFYWYGTAYKDNSGFVRTNYFQCYSSPDLMNWKKEGKLLVNEPDGIYYRPHVIYNGKTKKYVLWYNWYPKLWDGKYGVAVSDNPAGPFKIVNTDVKMSNSRYGVGDFGLFVDDDRTAYIAYNTIDGHKGSIEKLNPDYLSSTLENGGIITEGCEAGAIFKRNNTYYMLTDYTCCFCTQGSGVRVYVSDNPMKGYRFRNNINRYPGTPAASLVDGNLTPNIYSSLKRQQDNSLSPVQIDFSKDNYLSSLKIYQFTGNRFGCCDTTTVKCRADIALPEFELFVKQNDEWTKIQTKTTIETTSVYNIIHLEFENISPGSVLLKPMAAYPYDELFINKIEMYSGTKRLNAAGNGVLSFINDVNPMTALPVVPSQQTFVMPLATTNGIEYIWMGDLWGSASDNIKGHDYQYWGSPLVFDSNGDIEPMKWVDEWQTTLESDTVEKKIETLLRQMTVEEKVAQTLGIWSAAGVEGEFSADSAKKYFPNGLGSLHRRYMDQTYEEAANESNRIQKHFLKNTRLGIPVIINSEGLHGLVAKNATIFPSAMGLASSWDTTLFHKVYTVVAEESRALGIQHLFSPNLDIVRDPRWGRTGENFGEDPYLTTRLGVSCINSLQGIGNKIDNQHVAATAKHFAVHGQPEGGINQAPANISTREIYSMFLPPFKAAIDEANVRFIMASYNEIDGIPVHKNKWLLKNVLRDEFGYNGTIISDYYGIEQLHSKHLVAQDREEAAKLALEAGVDIDLCEPPFYSYPTLVEQIKGKKIPESILDESVRKILRLKFELGLFDNPYIDPKKANSIVNNEAHRKLALAAAYESIVLLKNDKKTLPLDKEKLKSIAVVGPNANTVQLGNYAGINEKATTVLEGIKKEFGKDKVKFAQGCYLPQTAPDGKVIPYDLEKNRKLIREAVEMAENCDVIVLAIGDNIDLCQELDGNRSGDIATLDLVGEQNELAKALYETGKPVIVLLFNGRPISFNYIKEYLPAIVECWHPGEATGIAVAGILSGKVNPSGKLPITFPVSVGHIPSYYNRKHSSPVKYVMDDRKYLYPFGYGLSYTKFEYKNLTVFPSTVKAGETAAVSVEIKNTGEVKGAEIVQLYIRDCLGSVTRPIKELKGFERVNLNPGESQTVRFSLTPDQLAFYNDEMEKVVEVGKFEIMVGSSSEAVDTVILNVK